MQYHDGLTYIIISFSRMSVSAQNSGLEVEHAKSNLKPSLSQILVICHLLPFVRVGQYFVHKGILINEGLSEALSLSCIDVFKAF